MDHSADVSYEKLPELYEKIWNFVVSLENSTESTNSDDVQKKVNDAVSECYKAIDMINSLQIFSSNESIEEITTLEIKYLLLPAYLGYFTNKITRDDRLDVIKKSRDCYRSFVKLCKTFGLTNVSLKSLENDDDNGKGDKDIYVKPDAKELIKADMTNRQAKIERYKAKNSIEKELQALYLEVKKEHVDEEMKRDYFLKLVKKWIADSLDALESMETEVPILEHIKKMRSDSKSSTEINSKDCNGRDCKSHSKKKFTPFIITKNQVQKQVFGLGYPSIPTVTVDEFYNERVQQGLFPAPDSIPKKIEKDEEAEEREKEEQSAEKEKRVEEDDEDELRKAREWDEHRDNHRRGWGNTHNKG